MISLLGRGLVLMALLFAVSGGIMGLVAGYRRSLDGWRQTRMAAYGFSASMIGANLLMIYALLARDFSVKYVAEVGSLSVPNWVAVVSLWASLNGSILFWGAILGVYVAAITYSQADKHREYMPYALGVLMLVAVFFTFLVASVADPFSAVMPVPSDGPGPNALLQNHLLMAFHPPMLYLGYVGMSVPFSMCCAALLAGRLDAGFMGPMRTFMLVPWTFLTIGIVMGGWWSYEVLGWGGYWAWDPVENASFMPWLTGTAFLHSAMVLQRRGTLKTWTLILGMSTFLLTLLGTFMTRSGVFNSVHSFTKSDIGPVFLGMMAACFVVSLLLLAFREHLLLRDENPVGGPQGVISRDTSVLLQNLLFAVFTFLVLFGVLYPLITEAVWERRVSVGAPYFDVMAMPIGLALVFFMGVGPAVPWGRMSGESAMKRFLQPVIAGFVAVGLGAALGIYHGYVLLAFFLCAFAFWANLGETIQPVLARMSSKKESFGTALSETVTRGRRRLGGHVAHFGVIIAVIAIAMSSAYKVEKDYILKAGEPAAIGEWVATYTGSHWEKEPRRDSLIASFDLSRNGQPSGGLSPRLNYYRSMREPVGTPAVRSRITGDLYVSLLQVENDGETVSIRAMTMPMVPWLWVSPVVIALGTLMVLWPQRKRASEAAPAGAIAGASV